MALVWSSYLSKDATLFSSFQSYSTNPTLVIQNVINHIGIDCNKHCFAQ